MVKRANIGDRDRGEDKGGQAFDVAESYEKTLLIVPSSLKILWITLRVGTDDNLHNLQRIWFSMNKITGGIHIGKYNAFAHKCAALTAGVHSKAATLWLIHYIKHHKETVYICTFHVGLHITHNFGEPLIFMTDTMGQKYLYRYNTSWN